MMIPRTFRRSIYLHKGPRVQGLRRDPEDVFQSQGISHEVNDSTTKYIKSFLTDKYAIPDDIILQVITHKSFANGIKPYNEKLASMGSKILNLYLAKYVLSQPTKNPNAINNLNFDVIGSPIAKELGNRMSLGLFAKIKDLNKVMFWSSKTHDVSYESSGELKISSQLVYALVGAVNFFHGKKATEEFIQAKFIDTDNSLETVTTSLLDHDREQKY